MLKKRIVAALLGIGPVLFLTWYGKGLFFLLILALSILALREFYKLTKLNGKLFRYAGQAGNVIMLFIMFRYGVTAFFYSFIIFCVFISLLWVIEFPRPLINVAVLLWGAFYITTLMGFFVQLRERENGFTVVLAVLLTVWAADSAAFFCGTFLGKHKLAPRVSPNKTLEGALGGVLAGMVIMLIMAPGLGLSRPVGVLLGVMLSMAGILGDLTESAIKRGVNVKDSGTFLPGHGGVLDRIDSLLFAAPVAYLFLITV